MRDLWFRGRISRPVTARWPISADRLHRAVSQGDFSIAHVARALNTTTSHAIYLLSQHPVDWSPPSFRRTRHTATRMRQWRVWCEQDRLSVEAIADRGATSLATVRLALLKDSAGLRAPPRRRLYGPPEAEVIFSAAPCVRRRSDLLGVTGGAIVGRSFFVTELGPVC